MCGTNHILSDDSSVKKNTKTIAGKTLRTSDHRFPFQNAWFMCWCSKCLSTVLQVMEKGGVSIGKFQTSY